ncbi:hypothetical protein ZWY2020_015547 [Hordeum vulgare]|nr:hypothetical protein ZWY2020_015547 [Hordeum vulgare]
MAASATTGVLNPLLGKLSQLLGEEYKKLTGVRKQASFLKDELSAMKALLDTMELMDNIHPSAKNWRDHIREMSYDMENCIDDFIHDIEGARAKKGFVRKMAQRLRRLGKRHQIANRIEDLKVLAVEANARRERYKIDECINSSASIVAVDPRIPALYREAASLVGIDGPKEELVSLLMDSEKKLKVVSIVGFGGLGKTTLAKQVYDEIGGQFTCKAFFSVSQRPDVKSLLNGLQLKLGMGDSSHAYELEDIIDRLREHLEQKRYLIIVDDLWDQSAWNTISRSTPSRNSRSRAFANSDGLPEGIKKMKSLCTLRCWDMSKSSLEDIKGLCELTNLKELDLTLNVRKCFTLEQEDALVSSIGMLRDLKSLRINWGSGCSEPDSQLDYLHSPPPRLEELVLPYWKFRRVPKWIGELCCLRILNLCVLRLSSDEVRVLGELPTLVCVSLHVLDVSQDKVVLGMGLFPVLEHFSFGSDKDVNAYLSFEAGAMPKLRRLELEFGWTEWRGDAPVSMECLPCLQDIDVWFSYNSNKNRKDVHAEVESAFKSAASLHPRHPSVTVTVGWYPFYRPASCF